MQIVRRQRRSRGREGDLRRPLVSIIGPCRVIIYFLIAFIRYICIYISILGEIFSIFVAALSLIKYRVGFFFFFIIVNIIAAPRYPVRMNYISLENVLLTKKKTTI